MTKSLAEFERDREEREKAFYDAVQQLRRSSQLTLRYAEGAGLHISPTVILNTMIDLFAAECTAESIDKFGYHPQIDELFITRWTD